MFETILVIVICILLIGGVGDFLFDAFGFGLKLFLGLVLVFASAYLVIKMFIAMIPWMLVISLIALIFGLVWLIKTVKRL